MIYLDNNATTRIDPDVLEEMLPFLREQFSNPSSLYASGQRVRKAIDNARERVAALLGATPGEIIFTSCGTESNNAAIWSALQIDPDRQHIVTTAVEHSAIVKQCEYLAKRGVEITWLKVDNRGFIDPAQFERALRSDTAIASLMWANNETGVLWPIEELAAIARDKGVMFHTDAVQAVGKVSVNVGRAPITALSLSGHKLHCPKGVGALFVRNRSRFVPFLRGGGQENGRRGGTENVASIVALGKAAELALEHLEEVNTRVRAMRDEFEHGVLQSVSGSVRNGDASQRLPNTSNISFENVDSEAALLLLDQSGVCCSAGSACTAGSIHPSHVLLGMGLDADRARGSLRFSFSRFNTETEVVDAVRAVREVVEKLRSTRPKSGAIATDATRPLAAVSARAE